MKSEQEAAKALTKILQQLDTKALCASEKKQFVARLETHFPALFASLIELYGERYDFFYYLQQIVNTLLTGYQQRDEHLHQLDSKRLAEPLWYRHQNMLGMACYVDLFAGDLKKLQKKLPYLQELGITYLHLMPLYAAPKGDSDGGYAVSDYRQVNPSLGDMAQLKSLCRTFSEAGISVVLDFVFNHTSDEHPWAEAAKQGDSDYQQFYYMFDDRQEPDQYEQNLREIFPQVRRGNFSFSPEANKWVWTTFNSFQWDLNYSNPEVFNAITGEMLFLANQGCEALRLDALAFIWKEKGTSCENQPKAHTLIRAFNACLQIVAPALVFKSEAIVHPDEVVKYIHKDECQLSYNPLLMALLWESLATRKTELLTRSMQKSFSIEPDCAWVNYIRCHDDIGWTFDDQVAHELAIDPQGHRHFLNRFYTGRFPGSFAHGVPFAENPSTGDCRACGSLASLAGLEQALEKQDKELLEHAIRRILLMHGIILSVGGVPLLYAGDELALLNDYSYREHPHRSHDERWVQRIPFRPQDYKKATTAGTPQQQVYQGLQQMIKLRKEMPVLGQSGTEFIQLASPHLFAFVRTGEQGERLTVVANFSEHPLEIPNLWQGQQDLLNSETLTEDKLSMAPYQLRWLQ
ncbi:amylosucrase [Lacimicrobium alkaliphilum]|uniref:Amylosucrase n=1 Tax=Lacimicrobium alkaliphilum TaxID=1526571 RepID=A0A0U2ZK90_9ALTE|nr:amylosucrase [Lacimicrobium alkaliphilum]ALS98748.1 amylosucrase [Lacimicrobium alkaliphilum]